MSARDEAVAMIRRICPAHLDADEYGRILAEKFDARDAEVRREATARIREFRPGRTADGFSPEYLRGYRAAWPIAADLIDPDLSGLDDDEWRASRIAARAEVRQQVADDLRRAEVPTFPAGESPEIVARTVRAVDVRIAEQGPEAPYGLADDATPDFFQPGRTYIDNSGRVFRCIALTTSPRNGEIRALGWYATSPGGWPSAEALDPGDFTHMGWTATAKNTTEDPV